MRIHTNENTMSNVLDAARAAGAECDVLTVHKSKTHEVAFEVTLSGNSRRRQNTGTSGRVRNYAATWDQWGVFLAILFNVDPDMWVGSARYPIYSDEFDFEVKTDGRWIAAHKARENVFAVRDNDTGEIQRFGVGD